MDPHLILVQSSKFRMRTRTKWEHSKAKISSLFYKVSGFWMQTPRSLPKRLVANWYLDEAHIGLGILRLAPSIRKHALHFSSGRAGTTIEVEWTCNPTQNANIPNRRQAQSRKQPLSARPSIVPKIAYFDYGNVYQADPCLRMNEWIYLSWWGLTHKIR